MPLIRKLAVTVSVLAILAPNVATAHPNDTEFRNGLLLGNPFLLMLGLYQLALRSTQPHFFYGLSASSQSPLGYAPNGYNRSQQFNYVLGYDSPGDGKFGFPLAVGGVVPAADTPYSASIFGSLGYSSTGSDTRAIEYDGNTVSASIGGALYASEHFLIGALADYSKIDVDTTFNRGNIEGSSFMAAPFLIYRANDLISFDASAGLGRLDMDTDRYDGFRTVYGETDGTQSFATVGISVDRQLGRLGLNGRLGYFYQRTEYDSFVESDGTPVNDIKNDLGFFTLDATAAYAFGAFRPYIGTTLRYFTANEQVEVAPYQTKPNDDDFDAILKAGFDVQVSQQLNAGLHFQHLVGNSNLDQTGVRGSVTFRF